MESFFQVKKLIKGANHKQIENLFQLSWRARALAWKSLLFEAKNKSKSYIVKRSTKLALLTERAAFNKRLLELILFHKGFILKQICTVPGTKILQNSKRYAFQQFFLLIFLALLYVMSFISFRYQNVTEILPSNQEKIIKFRATGLVRGMEDEIFFSFIGFLKSKHSKSFTIGRHLNFILENAREYYSEISSIVAELLKSKQI